MWRGKGTREKNAKRKKQRIKKRTLGVLRVENRERKKRNPLRTWREWYCRTDRKCSEKSKHRSCCGKKSQQAEACCGPITRPFGHEQTPWLIIDNLFFLITTASAIRTKRYNNLDFYYFILLFCSNRTICPNFSPIPNFITLFFQFKKCFPTPPIVKYNFFVLKYFSQTHYLFFITFLRISSA